MSSFDLDAARAARREAEDEATVVVFGGTKYEMPPAPPATVLVGLGRVQEGRLVGLEDVIGGLFGREAVPDVLAAGFDLEDLAALFSEVYGMDVGEPPASGG